ncbi:MAG: NAD(P)H-dependent oxidoreductase subunit E, partial [Candidatus Dormibacteraeota bacterium]|nr:NAD(P)H-dependent oxidoreductase subunit E [Candidatus Dormibacteraeota bacterium]
CLGACEYAPMMRYANRYHYDLTPEKVDALIEAARRGDPPAGPEPEAEPEPKPRNNQAAGAEPRPRQRNNRTRKNA